MEDDIKFLEEMGFTKYNDNTYKKGRILIIYSSSFMNWKIGVIRVYSCDGLYGFYDYTTIIKVGNLRKYYIDNLCAIRMRLMELTENIIDSIQDINNEVANG